MKKYLNFIAEFVQLFKIKTGFNSGVKKMSILIEIIKFVKLIEKNSLGIKAARYEKITSSPPTIIKKII